MGGRGKAMGNGQWGMEEGEEEFQREGRGGLEGDEREEAAAAVMRSRRSLRDVEGHRTERECVKS